MTGRELERHRIELEMTQLQLARFFGVDDRTVRRWTSGATEIPIAIAMVVRLMARHEIDATDAYRLATGRALKRRA